MFTKAVLSALLTACSVSPDSAAPPDSQEPDEPDPDYIFCCNDVDAKAQTGDGCVTIGVDEIDTCSTVLTCGSGFTKKDGVVTCTRS